MYTHTHCIYIYIYMYISLSLYIYIYIYSHKVSSGPNGQGESLRAEGHFCAHPTPVRPTFLATTLSSMIIMIVMII